jgi:CRISPR-associated endonuclease/helicase Cas3
MNSIAHVIYDSGNEHLLCDHLRAVAKIAGESNSSFGEWACLAGRWHDLGKYSQSFQDYIRCESGYEAHLVDNHPGRVNHSSAGALYALEQLGTVGRLLAYVIAGHHAGLADWSGNETGAAALEQRIEEGRFKNLLAQSLQGPESPPEDILKGIQPKQQPGWGSPDALHLWLRLVFSAVVDADFLDTEAFMDMAKANDRGVYPTLKQLAPLFLRYMTEKTQKNAPPGSVNAIRGHILDQCITKAVLPPGLFSLTVPTGGGKTLSSMAFALNHAQAHGKRRIIYAIPYTSIIEQTAEVFRGIFGEAVLEHHSNFDPDKETQRSRLAAENWDAPLIVTTHVQLFESLFAARTSRCRKLHNIVDSVVILDEAQLLSVPFLQPMIDVINLLTLHCGVTFVLCTATQPKLEGWRDSFGRSQLRGLENVREIIDDVPALYTGLDRVSVTLPAEMNTPADWDSLACELQQFDSVLIIVNSRADCRELHSRMPDAIHLSALMCGEHRSEVIADIRRRLKSGIPTRVVSTQLIEAGVDVDFPVVYRALAGLDSIAQAAGRCNREGCLEGKGKVVVFVPPKPAPAGLMRLAEEASKAVLYLRPSAPLSPETFSHYFQQYYGRAGAEGLDKHGIVKLLTANARQLQIQFRTAADRFRLVEEGISHPVIVSYACAALPDKNSAPLIALLQQGIIHRELTRRLQRYTVNLYDRDFNRLRQQGDITEPISGVFVLNGALYHSEMGVLLDDLNQIDPANHII